MATTSKKKQANQFIDEVSDRIKSGVDDSAEKAKRASHRTIDLTRQAKHKVKRSPRKAMNTSGEMIEETGKSIKQSGRSLKKAA
jgi:hypothetical protein